MMTGMQEGTEQRFDLRDGQRPITFVGWMVANADSQSGTNPRWTELSLYRTITGRYVLEKIGRSDVFHSPGCKRKSGAFFESLDHALEADQDRAEDDAYVPCDICKPDFAQQPVYVERDISAVAVYAEPEQLVDALFRKDADNMRYLSRVSRELLDEAASRDEGIAGVMSSPADIT